VLPSSIVQYEHVAGEEIVQKKILSEQLNLRLCRPVLLSGKVQSEHVAAGESVQKTILSEH